MAFGANYKGGIKTMAIISTEEIYFLGKRFRRQVRVLRDGLFRIKYPDFIAEVTGQSEVCEETIDSALAKFGKTLELFEKANTSKRKIIIYEIQDKISFSKGIAIGVAASIFNEIRVKMPDGKDHYKYESVGYEDNLPHGLRLNARLKPYPGDQLKAQKYMEWTPERHAFFIKIYEAMDNLKNKMAELGDDHKKMIRFADKGLLLLGQ